LQHNKTSLTAERARELLRYEPDNPPEIGCFFWRIGPRAGKRSGSVKDRTNYRRIKIDGRRYREQRLAVLMTTGEWPPGNVDHKNRDRGDNRWSNLRPANNNENQWNRGANAGRSLPKGVRKRGNQYGARIGYKGVKYYLSHFLTPESAHAAYAKAAYDLHGEFARAA